MAIPKDSGAQANRIGWKKQLRAYGFDHQRIARQSLLRLLRQPVNSLMTWLVIGIAMALPVSLYVVLGNVQTLSERWDGDARISVFLKHEITRAQAEALQAELGKWKEIDNIQLISREEGLEEFQKLSGTKEVLAQLEQNPLPNVLDILPGAEYGKPEQLEELLKRIQELPQIDMAQLDMEWVKRLEALLQLGKSVAFILVLMLSMGVLLVIGNTIRLEIENRRQEILVVKLIGGTDAFIKRPFLYTGFWYGFGGGLVASLIVAGWLALLNKPVATLAGLYQSDYALLSLSVKDTLSLWMLSGWLGFFGAWFAVSRHLDQLEPT